MKKVEVHEMQEDKVYKITKNCIEEIPKTDSMYSIFFEKYRYEATHYLWEHLSRTVDKDKLSGNIKVIDLPTGLDEKEKPFVVHTKYTNSVLPVEDIFDGKTYDFLNDYFSGYEKVFFYGILPMYYYPIDKLIDNINSRDYKEKQFIFAQVRIENKLAKPKVVRVLIDKCIDIFGVAVRYYSPNDMEE